MDRRKLNELQKKWNTILKNEELDVVRPNQPNSKEKKLQRKSRKKGLPEWAHWGKPGNKYGKGYRK